MCFVVVTEENKHLFFNGRRWLCCGERSLPLKKSDKREEKFNERRERELSAKGKHEDNTAAVTRRKQRHTKKEELFFRELLDRRKPRFGDRSIK
jgi:hypothetical protein